MLTLMNKRATAKLLLLALISTAAIGCGTGETVSDQTSVSADSTAKAPDPSEDELPEGLNFGGKKVTFLYRNEIATEFYVESQTGDVVDDAVYDSMSRVEERLNVDIVTELRDGHYVSARADYMNHIRNTVAAGDAVYDWVDLMIGNATLMMSEGLFLNIADNRYINYEKPYYLSGLIENAAIDGRLYLISGDASLGFMKSMYCMYFNKQVAESYKIENLYELVDSGKWTIDKLLEIAAIASSDVDGSGKYDEKDKLGFLLHDHTHRYGFWMSTASDMYQRNGNDWQFDYGSERDIEICDLLNTLLYNAEGSYFPGITSASTDDHERFNQLTDRFANGEILIKSAEVHDAVTGLRSMKADYGILPFPKYDENDEYRSASRSTHNSFSMPVTCVDPDMAGAVLEALSSSNYKITIPAYFEVALKAKYSRDDDSARMYDLIRSSMQLSFTYLFMNAIGNPDTVFLNCLQESGSAASSIASNRERLELKLGEYLETVRSIEA